MRHQQVFTVALSAVLEKFANRVLTSNFDQIATRSVVVGIGSISSSSLTSSSCTWATEVTCPALLETPAAGSISRAADMYRRTAGYIAKIFRETKATDATPSAGREP